jgi:hypothetical protein
MCNIFMRACLMTGGLAVRPWHSVLFHDFEKGQIHQHSRPRPAQKTIILSQLHNYSTLYEESLIISLAMSSAVNAALRGGQAFHSLVVLGLSSYGEHS